MIFVSVNQRGYTDTELYGPFTSVEVAKQMNVTTYVLTGQTGGKLKALCNCLCIPSPDTARIQECHILLGHILCGQVEKRYFKG